jgi:hypothetical protein
MMGVPLLGLSRNDFELRVARRYKGGNHEKCEKDLRGSVLWVYFSTIILTIIYQFCK